MSSLSPEGLALVRASRRALQPTDADRARLHGALRSRLGAAALPAELGSGATVAATGHAMWPIMSVVVLGVGILGGTLYLARRPGSGQANPQGKNVTSVAVTAPLNADIAPPPVEEPTNSAVTVPAAESPEPAEFSTHRAQDRLAAEVAILSRATRDLHAGRPAEALNALDEYRRKFPKGLLREEHLAARAESLCALGRFEEAHAKLAGLAPQSPLAARAKQFCHASRAAR